MGPVFEKSGTERHQRKRERETKRIFARFDAVSMAIKEAPWHYYGCGKDRQTVEEISADREKAH
jgi:hypothetical protein